MILLKKATFIQQKIRLKLYRITKKKEGKMANGFHFQNVGLSGKIQKTPLDTGLNPTSSINSLEEENKETFADVVSDMAGNFNKDLNAPEVLLKKVMSGDNSVDIHDVMVAMSKAELNVSVATQLTSKVIQAYEKITQISV